MNQDLGNKEREGGVWGCLANLLKNIALQKPSLYDKNYGSQITYLLAKCF